MRWTRVTWRRLRTGLLAADLAWIGLAVAAAGRADAGLTLLYTLVAFAAGFAVGGKAAMGLGTAAACSLAVLPLRRRVPPSRACAASAAQPMISHNQRLNTKKYRRRSS